MSISTIRERFAARLRDFAWNEWAHMGVLATPQASRDWAQDPEALVVFTLEVARDDPRLFDEVLDWLLTNERMVAIRRLRTFATTAEDRRLVDAALAWMASHRGKGNSGALAEADGPHTPLFRERLPVPVDRVDPAFASQGLRRSRVDPTHKASTPDTGTAINFAFRLRHFLGVTARAEVVRLLLTVEAPRATSQLLARSAGYTKRNVYEALNDLHVAGVIEQTTVGAEQWFSIERKRWARFLGVSSDALPRHRDWPQLLRAAVTMLRWLDNEAPRTTSAYLLNSQALDLLEKLQSDLRYAGVAVPIRGELSTAVDDIAEVAEALLRQLEVP